MLIVFYCKIMPFFSIWDHSENSWFFANWVMLWNINRIYFFFFNIQNIKRNCYMIFLKFFPIIFFLWKIYSFSLIFIYKRFNFRYSLQIFFYFFEIWRNCYSKFKAFIIFFMGEIYCCFFVFFIQSGESIYDPPWFGFIV